MEEETFFGTNPQKSANKVTINSFMMGSLFFVLTLIITLDPHKFSKLVIYELVLAIPLLYVSSLAYSKIGYWKEIRGWDMLGWYTNTVGNLFVLNAVGLVAANYNKTLAMVFFILFCLLMTIYTYINIMHNDRRDIFFEYIFKLAFLLAVTICGGIVFVY